MCLKEQDSLNHNYVNEAIVKMLMDNGAEEILKLEIPNHRLPSVNQVLGGKRKEALALKKSEKKKTWQAIDSASLSTLGGLPTSTIATSSRKQSKTQSSKQG